MKIALLFCAIVFLSFNSFARVAFGPEVGLSISKLNYSASGSQTILGVNIPALDFTNSRRMGGRFGAIADINILPNLSVQPGIYYTMMGGGQKGSTKVTLPTTFTGQFGSPIPLSADINVDTKTTLNYIQVPVNVIYHFHNLFAGIGPYIGYALNGNIKGTRTATVPLAGDIALPAIDSTISFGSDKNQIKRIDYGASITAGYDLPFGLFVRVYYQLGLAELSNDLNSSGKNRNFGISVGYLYNRRR